MNTQPPGRLIVVSGPSGVGKSTVVRRLMETCELPLELSVSATTRDPRDGEIDGVDYQFLGPAEFHRLREEGKFLECVEVFGQDEWYGTLREPVTSGLNRGKWIILEIDVTGAKIVCEQHPGAITIFVHPGSLEELERRLRGRETENEQDVLRRLQVAQQELELSRTYRYIVVNRDIENTSREICQILRACGESSQCMTN